MRHRGYNFYFKNKNKLGIFIILFTFIIISFVIDARIRPIVKTMSAYQAKVFSGKVINEAVLNELSKEDITYDKIVTITLNEKGEVTSLQTDIIALNKLRTNIINSVLDSIDEISTQDIKIPIGTLTGVQILSGRGPRIDFDIIPAGYIETKMQNKFDSAGINQTRHQIMLTINLTVTAIIPGYTTSTDVNANFCLAETVIVGSVPEAFTQVIDSQGDTTGDIFDYGAERNFTVDRSPET